ncbi:T9SS type A sorting domain-containing protein, partial [bacterium]|nr:T9SS type A sorting domain-containing protein [bacterium]
VSFRLEQNYPNPFNPSTTLRFTLSQASRIRLEVFDLLGRHTSTITEGLYTAGSHEFNWSCPSCASGLYILQLTDGSATQQRKMLFLK